MPTKPNFFQRCNNRAPMDPDNEQETSSPAPRKQNLDFFNDIGLKFLVSSKKILADATLKTAPPPCYQVYVIFESSREWKIPVVWALLGGKMKNFIKSLTKNPTNI